MTKKTNPQQSTEASGSAQTAESGTPTAVAAGSKAAAVIDLLKQEGGATLEQMMEATGWQKHSVRGFMAGALKKRHGLTVQSTKVDGVRTYRAESAA